MARGFNGPATMRRELAGTFGDAALSFGGGAGREDGGNVSEICMTGVSGDADATYHASDFMRDGSDIVLFDSALARE